MNISQNELARRAKISKAALSEALADESLASAAVPEIHRALGWPIPTLVLKPDALEMQALFEQLGDQDRGGLLERARMKVEEMQKLAALRNPRGSKS
jgi:transcriptional regulator with XRE-family HTH domain